MYRQSEKKLLSSSISSTCPNNTLNFGPLAAEIVSLVWGTSANFNGFRILAALLHGTLVVGVSQTAALNRERHLYSTGRPSRWALANISSFICALHTLSVSMSRGGLKTSRYVSSRSRLEQTVERLDLGKRFDSLNWPSRSVHVTANDAMLKRHLT